MSYQIYCPKCNEHIGSAAIEDMDAEKAEIFIKSVEDGMGSIATRTCNQYICHYESRSKR